jgi:hypothetical protein
MKAIAIALLLTTGASQASMSPGNFRDQQDYQDHYEWHAPTVTINAVLPVTAKKPQPPLRLSRTKQQQVQILARLDRSVDLDDQPTNGYDDIDIQVAYRRSELVDQIDSLLNDDPLPKHIMTRLAQARALALAKHREIHAQQ